MEKRVIVTGSNGLLGKVTSDFLKLNKWEVLEVDLQLGHDLTDEKFVIDWFSKNNAYGLVNLFALNDNIAIQRKSSNLFDISLDSFDRYLKLNLTALFSVCREFAKNNNKGSIVNFTSIYGQVSPIPKLYSNDQKHIGYGVSKAGVIQLTRHLATHLAPTIRVNCILPGGIKQTQNQDFIDNYSEFTPLQRMGEPKEIPGMVEFLLSDNSTYCTGGLYPIDGGWTSW